MSTSSEQKIRVAVTYRVCQGWRAPIFARLASQDNIELKLFHGEDIQGTKILNTKDFTGIPHKEMKTFSIGLRSTGRDSTWIIYPNILYHLSKFKPDVLLCEGGSNIFNNFLIYMWAFFTRTPTICWTLGYIPGRKHRGISRVFRSLARMLMRRSSVLLGYSSRAKRYFEECGCDQPMHVAVNCIDTDRVLKRIEEARANPIDVRGQLGLGNKTVLIFVGALIPAKDLDNLIKAYAEIRSQRDDVALLIVGDGVSMEGLQQLAEELGASDVHFAGRIIDEVSHYFLAGDIFVLPGLGGLAISEAMCHELPMICTVADGCEEDLVVDGQNGLILPTNDVPALISGISGLLDDPEKIKRMGQASLGIIKNQHNVNTYFQGIMDAIHSAYNLRCKPRKT